MYFKIDTAFDDGIALSKIAEVSGAKLVGDPEQLCHGFSPLNRPQANTLSFSNKDKQKDKTNLAAIFVKEDFNLENPSHNYLIAKDPQKALIKTIALFYRQRATDLFNPVNIDETTQIGENTFIHPNAIIYPHVKIGDNCIIHAGCCVREYSEIGNNVILQNSCVIGADGFGYLADTQGILSVPQIGYVKIEDNVEIGAHSCIDRATLGATTIGTHTKIDNLVQIGHNVEIGAASMICGQVGIAGSCEIGSQVVLGGNVKVADHLKIGSNCRFAGNSVVLRNILEPGDYGGNPAVPISTWRRNYAILRDLQKYLDKVCK